MSQTSCDLKRLNILVIEDNSLLRAMFRKTFQGKHHVYGSEDAGAGWRLYLEKKPDIIFLDIHLPDASGHDLARRIKAHDSGAYIVMATVSDRIEDKEAADLNHADGFIVKPFNKAEIGDCLERYRRVRARDT